MTGSCMHWPELPGWVQGAVFSRISWLHMKPASIWQPEEQPSPELLLPSSQISPGSMLPLPQLVAHACVAPVALRQAGSLVHVFVQPVASPKNTPFGPLQPVG